MSYAIHWTDESKTTINENLEYLSRKWDLKTMNTFLNRVEEVLESIAQNPNLYPVHRKSDKVHKCVVNKHSTLYSRVASSKRIDLITFWNTHQDPKKLKL